MKIITVLLLIATLLLSFTGCAKQEAIKAEALASLNSELEENSKQIYEERDAKTLENTDVRSHDEQLAELQNIALSQHQIMGYRFSELKSDMSCEEICKRLEIFGTGVLVSETGAKGDPDYSATYRWDGDNGETITCIFVNDELETKSQTGLE